MKVHKGNRDSAYWAPKELAEENLPETPRHKNKKDTKRWCLGKVGREHVPQMIPLYVGDRIYWWSRQCLNCKKHLKQLRAKK